MAQNLDGRLENGPAAADSLPFVSVIIPHLNQPDLLPLCLESLMRQTYPADRFEILVVDNGSKTSIDSIAARYERTRALFEARPGAGMARNRGIEDAQGDTFVFTDADCVVEADWIEQAVRALQNNSDADIIGGDVKILIENPEDLTVLEAYESVFQYRQKEYIEKEKFSGTGNLAFSRAVFEKVGPFRGIESSEDRDWGQRASGMGYRIQYCSEMIIYHPARKSFEEIFSKWNRHIQHDYNRFIERGWSKGRWFGYSFAVFASAFIHLIKVARSNRISGLPARIRAGRALVKIRLYRFGRMLKVSSETSKVREAQWNR